MAYADQLFDRRPEALERLLPAFANAGIEQRYAAMPLEWFSQPHDWKERQDTYLTVSLTLLEEAAAKALQQAGLPADAIDAIVTVSSTGVVTPTLDAQLMQRLPFRRDVVRVPLFGLGCAGGVLGLARAADLVRSGHRNVLLLVVELCTLTFRRQDRGKSNVIAAALFADGAAALVIGAGDGPRITAAGEWTWPDTLDVMGWRNESDGFGVLFSRDIPALVSRDFVPALDAFLARHHLSRTDIDAYACHPGGAKVVDALAAGLPLDAASEAAARSVLRDYGNMSAPTVLFVLRELLARKVPRTLMTALGPGFTAAFLLLEQR